MDESQETLGERVRRIRKEQGITALGLAEQAGISEGTLRQIENGNTKDPAFTNGLRIAAALHVDPAILGFGAPGWDTIRLLQMEKQLADRIAALASRVTALERRR
jgi:transcriptional regulator with XRE-family HTH domain